MLISSSIFNYVDIQWSISIEVGSVTRGSRAVSIISLKYLLKINMLELVNNFVWTSTY